MAARAAKTSKAMSAALRWLGRRPPAEADAKTLAQGLQRRWMKKTGGVGEDAFSFDTGEFRRLLARQLAPLPARTEDFVLAALGLGEIQARSHTRIARTLKAAKRLSRSRLGWYQVLVVAHRISPPRWPIVRAHHGAAQAFCGARMDRASFKHFLSWMHRGPDREPIGYYGLSALLSICLDEELPALERWIQRNTHHPITSLVPRILAEQAYYGRTGPEVMRHWARASHLGFRLFAAACITRLRLPQHDSWAELLACGFTAQEATWMAVWRIEDAHRVRVRVRDTIEQLENTQRALPSLPRHMVPDREADSIRIARTQVERLPGLRQDSVVAEANWTFALQKMIEHWPAAGLDEAALKMFDDFRDDLELRYQIAAAVPHPGNALALHRNNVAVFQNRFQHEAGPKAEALILPSNWQAHVHWAAQSQVAMRGPDLKTAAMRTGRALHPLQLEAEAALARPYWKVRNSSAYRSMVLRYATALGFAFEIAEVGRQSATSTGDVDKLESFAIENTVRFLGLIGDIREQVVDDLTLRVVRRAVERQHHLPALEALADEPLANPFARAIILWAVPGMVGRRPADAGRAHEDVAQLSLARRHRGRDFWRLLNFVDVALAAAARDGDPDKATPVLDHWAAHYAAWKSHPQAAEFEKTASLLWSALQGDSSAIQSIEDPASPFRRSAVTELIQARRSPLR